MSPEEGSRAFETQSDNWTLHCEGSGIGWSLSHRFGGHVDLGLNSTSVTSHVVTWSRSFSC